MNFLKMLYKETCDYINNNLKRSATDDEIQLLNNFWDAILPYRYLKKTNKKFFKKNVFADKDVEKIKIKNHSIAVKSYFCDSDMMMGEVNNKLITKGVISDGVIISTSDKNKLKFSEKYFHMLGLPIITQSQINCRKNSDCADIFSLKISPKKQILKNKIQNGLNIIVVGNNTVVSHDEKDVGYMQKKIFDLSNEVFEKKLVSASQSCENGIFYAIMKLISKKSWGVFLNINNLHREEGDYALWEYMVSKTPERMIFAVQNWKLVDFIKITDKYEVPFSIIGKIDNSKSVKVVYNNSQTVCLDKKFIFEPMLKIENEVCNNFDKNYEYGENITNENIKNIIFDKQFFNNDVMYKFNSYVGNKTDYKSDENSIVELWYKELKRYVAITVDSDNVNFKYNPYVAGQNCVFENVRKLVAFGHKPKGICINYHMENSGCNSVSIFNKFRDGVLFAAKKSKIKVLNVSISSSTENGFSVLMLGVKKKRGKLFVPYFENAQKVYLIGKLDNLPATSSYQEILNGKIYPYPDGVNSKFENKLIRCVKKLQKENLISGIIPVNRFGIAGALIKALILKKLGFKSEHTNLNLNYLFNEIQSRFLIATTSDIVPILNKYKIPYILLGKTKSPDYIELGGIKLDCNELYND